MATTPRTRFTRVMLPPIAVAAVMGGTFAAPASAAVAEDPVTATFVEHGPGLNRVVPDADGDRRSAGSVFLALPDGTKVEAFCLEFEKFVAEDGTYTAVPWAKTGKSAAVLSQAAYIAESHEDVGTPYTDPAWETAAAQVAIWELTDTKLVDATKLGNKKFAERVDALVASANADAESAATEPVLAYELEGTKSVKGEGETSLEVISGKLTSTTGAPVANQAVAFVVDGEEKVVTTDEAGVASLELPRSEAARTVSLRFTAEVEPGTVFQPSSADGQAMVSADGFTIERQASLTIAAYVPPVAVEPTPEAEPTPEPEQPQPTVSPKPEPEAPKPVVDVPKKLPTTGGTGVAGLLAAAAGLTGAGIAGRRLFRK